MMPHRSFPSVSARFAFIAARHPDNIAIATPHETLRYAEVQARTDRLARGLVSRNIKKGDRVGVAMPRSADFCLTVLAIMKAGAVFVPLDPDYPKARLEQMIALGQLALIVADLAEIPETDEEGALPGVERDDPAYIMFTSGSTGTPKGVVVPHRGILRLVIAPDYVTLGPDEIIPQLSPTAFDASTFEIWGALLNGGTLAVPAPGKFSVAELGAFLKTCRATTAFFSTGFFHVIIDEQPEILSTLQQAVAGGDALSAAHVRRLLAVAPETRVVNGYGPTETTTFALCHVMTKATPVPDPVPIGRPITATDAFVLDAQLRTVEDGAEGELYIGGDGVALGYIGNDDETKARFIAGPDGRLLYKTGDMVQRDAAGCFTFRGRADQQLKIRGFRIEPGEIEACLREHALVRDAVVVAKTGAASTDKTLVAFVVLARQEGDWQEDLRRHLLTVLPAFMLPSGWAALEQFPLGPTGKVDRKALAALPLPGARAAISGTGTETEALVCRLCADILNVPAIGAADNFLKLGGDSLGAARLAARLESATGATLRLGQILAAEALRDIAALVDDPHSKSKQVAALQASSLSRLEFPLSFAQEQLWLVYCADPHSAAYNEPCLISMPKAVAPAVVEAALAGLAERHSVLRTTYGMKDDAPCQRIHSSLRIPFVLHADVEDDFDAAAELDIAQPFDLEHGPIARARYALAEDGSAKLLLVIHHIAFDGISLFGTLLPELQHLCLHADRSLPELPLRYADFADWQRHMLAPEALEEELQHWESRLDDVAPVALPFRAGKPEGSSHALTIPAPLAMKMRALAQREGISLFAVTASALVALLHRYTYQDDLLIGFVHASRPAVALDGVVGGFVNTLALRTTVARGTSIRDLLRQTWTSLREAQDHDSPFEAVAARLSQKLHLRGRALIDVLISYDPPPPPLAQGWVADHLAFGKAAPKFPLCIELGDAPDGSLYGRIEHDASFIPVEAARRMADHFRAFLEAATDDAETAVERVDLLSSAEKKQLSDSGHTSDSRATPFAAVGDMLAQAARAWPQREAFVFGTQRVTYAALQTIVRAKAAALRAHGLAPGKTAALLIENPLQRCIAAWSVWVAGGAIAPLDPEYPEDRIRYCLEQIPAVMVLTDAVFEALAGGCDGEAGVSADDLAYVIFTSGSTGRPKGVMISHRNICAMVGAHIEALGPDRDLRSLQMAGPGFDAYVSELLFTCANAGTLVLAERKSLLPGTELAALIAREHINDAFFTPTLLAYLDPAEFPSLKTITVAGDHCPPELATRWIQAGVRFIHAYGPAECSVCSTLAVIDRPRHDFLPLGQPLPGYRVYLLDPWGNLALPGAIGEICIGGVGVGMGYLGEAAPADRFVPDPFSNARGARLYRTGDLGRFDAHGELEFMGRNDAQIKIRGMRVEPGEIETLLLEHPGIAMAAVTTVGSGVYLALGAVVEFRAAPSEGWRAELSKQLKLRLPAHMVPTYFAAVDHMPVTANGKIDRRCLPAFTDGDRAVKHAATSPLTAAERTLLGVWREIFPNVAEDANADFFDLGGHSLLAARLVARVNERFDADMPMRALFENPTVGGMAAWLADASHAAPAKDDPVADATRPLDLPALPFLRADSPDILLTGVSGFVGRHLLWQLLASTDAHIHCLARGGNQEHERLLHLLDKTGPVDPTWHERLHIVHGDLAAPDLLEEGAPAFRAIYHCGALVNSIYPYSATRAANVEGTRRLLEYAARCGADFNHISTVGVFEGALRHRTGPIGEDEFPGGPPPLLSGYNCSKWVSEMLVRQAQERGVRARIFRLGRVAWSNRTGQWNDNDFLCRLLRGCLRLGSAPDWKVDFRVVPVDFLATAVVTIAETPAAEGLYHLVGNTVLRWPALSDHFRLRVLPHADWWHALAADADNPLSTLVERLYPGAEMILPPPFTTQRTDAVLKDIGLTEPPADLETCKRHL
jgi:amino acid adenylation domain-containing protein/thioester reductase-like protein